MIGNVPNLRMEVAFTTDPLTRPDEEDWADLAEGGVCVQDLSTRRGARVRTGEIVTGRATAVVQYPDRVLEPGVSTSPWYPDVDLRKRVRFIVERPTAAFEDGGSPSDEGLDVHDGGDPDDNDLDIHDGGGPDDDSSDEAVIWTGFIESLPTSWRKKVASSTVSAVGLLGLVSNIALPPSVLDVTMRSLDLYGYWPMTETAGQSADDVIGERDGRYYVPATSTAELVPFDARPTAVVDTIGQGMVAGAAAGPVEGAGALSGGLWFRWQQGLPATQMYLLTMHQAAVATTVSLRMLPELSSGTPTGRARLQLIVSVLGEGFIEVETDYLESLFTERPRFFGFSVTHDLADSDSEAALYVNGAAVSVTVDRSNQGTMTASSLEDEMEGINRFFAGWREVNSNPVDSKAVVGHAFMAHEVLDASDFEAIWEAGTEPWDGDTTGERIERVLDLAGVDPDDCDIDTGTEVCGPAVLGVTLGAYLKAAAATEGGALFESADGKITFRERVANDPVRAFVLSDDPDGDSGVPYESIAIDYSMARMVNRVNVTRVGSGGAQIVEAADSVGAYGPAELSLTTLHGNATDARDLAYRIVTRTALPRRGFDGVTVDSRMYGEVPSTVSLDVEVGDAADFYARPDDDPGGTPYEAVVVVESVEQQLRGSGEWKTAFGTFEHVVLPCFELDGPGLDESVWCDE